MLGLVDSVRSKVLNERFVDVSFSSWASFVGDCVVATTRRGDTCSDSVSLALRVTDC